MELVRGLNVTDDFLLPSSAANESSSDEEIINNSEFLTW